MIHELKTWIEFFDAVYWGDKTFEVRKNDRNFKEGDILILKEFDSKINKYTGRETVRHVSYVLQGGSFGIEKGFVVLGLKDRLFSNSEIK